MSWLVRAAQDGDDPHIDALHRAAFEAEGPQIVALLDLSLIHI